MNTELPEWTTKVKLKCVIKRVEATKALDDPLKSTTINYISRRKSFQPCIDQSQPQTLFSSSLFLEPCNSLEGIDPLSQFVMEKSDPLSQKPPELLTRNIYDNVKNTVKTKYEMEQWSARKNYILSKYTTSKKLSIITSFFEEGEKVIVKTHHTPIDKVQHRLEQLDYFEEGSQVKLDLTQSEYLNKIDQLNKELVSAWNSEHRVKALKISIQCAKLLADTDVIQFYPSKFVLITDILDIFGNLVYQRLKMKANYSNLKDVAVLPENFKSEMVPESAKETCRNWFYKIASIRELIPRLYIEMAILKSYSFLTTSEFSAALIRLTRMIRGIGNPLVAAYARCYLCRVGITVNSTDSEYLTENFNDFLDCYNQLFSPFVCEELKIQGLPLSTYLTLYQPALEFIVETIACNASDNLLMDILKKCQNVDNCGLLINTIITSFNPAFVSGHPEEILHSIKKIGIKQSFPFHILLSSYGRCINTHAPPLKHRKKILGDVWGILAKLEDPEQYIACIEIWIRFIVQYFTTKELNLVLANIIDRLSRKRMYENFYPQLKNIISIVVNNAQDFEALLSLDTFLPLVDLFQRENVKVDVCKTILNAYISAQQQTSDPVITNALLFLCSVLHDSINALTVEDEKRQIAEILCTIVKRVDHGRDYEQQLSFYVDARGMFTNLDQVLTQLVQCVNLLAVNTKMVVKGCHTKKTSAFVRACTAYCFITIPSIKSTQTRLELYLLSGKVAIFNNCLGQADSFVEAILTTLPEQNKLPEEKNQNFDTFFVSFINNLLSTLLIVPDCPDRGVLTLIRALLKVLKNLKLKDAGILVQIYINVIAMLSTMTQETFPYHVDTVESNNSLYGCDPKFTSEVEKICSFLLHEIINRIKTINSIQSQIIRSLELLSRIVFRGDLTNNFLSTLVLNLWHFCLKNGMTYTKYLEATRKSVEFYGNFLNDKKVLEIAEKLHIPKTA